MRTIARAARPSRATLIVAGLAVLAAIGMHFVAWLTNRIGLPASRIGAIATTFEAMPLWIIAGSIMHQVAAAIDNATRATPPTSNTEDGCAAWRDELPHHIGVDIDKARRPTK